MAGTARAKGWTDGYAKLPSESKFRFLNGNLNYILRVNKGRAEIHCFDYEDRRYKTYNTKDFYLRSEKSFSTPVTADAIQWSYPGFIARMKKRTFWADGISWKMETYGPNPDFEITKEPHRYYSVPPDIRPGSKEWNSWRFHFSKSQVLLLRTISGQLVQEWWRERPYLYAGKTKDLEDNHFHRHISMQELESRLNDDAGIFVQNADGIMIPLWKEQIY